MGKVEQLEQQIRELSPAELAQFRAWFLDFDWEDWDRQLEDDVRAGKLDALGDKALRDSALRETPLVQRGESNV
jgi:hypothetical protein